MTDRIESALAPWGAFVRGVPVERLAELRGDMEVLARAAADAYYSQALMYMPCEVPEDFSDARSVLIVAMPSPALEARFGWAGGWVSAFVPPAYADCDTAEREVEGALQAVLMPEYRVRTAHGLPRKLLAVRSGLCEYGRNSVCYHDKMGSFFDLYSYFTDMPCGAHEWRAPRLMAACEGCGACIRQCPTGAIPEREPYHPIFPSRCLTNLNESGGAFPNWLDPAAHNAVVGCIKCQLPCPQNRAQFARQREAVCFDEGETRLIMSGTPFEGMDQPLRERIERIGMHPYRELLARNVSALIAQSSKT